MVFRNVKTGAILTTDNEDVIEMMASSPVYEKVEPASKPSKGAKAGKDREAR